MSADDPLVALTPDDRAWLRAHGWREPPPEPRWVDEEGGDMVIRCGRCGRDVPLEYHTVAAPDGAVWYVVDDTPTIEWHVRECAGR